MYLITCISSNLYKNCLLLLVCGKQVDPSQREFTEHFLQTCMSLRQICIAVEVTQNLTTTTDPMLERLARRQPLRHYRLASKE
jgi:hypothetical protein